MLMRAAGFLGVLAVIVGIFGMHVMTGSHASHAGAGHVAHSSTTHSSTTHSGDPVHPGGVAVVVLYAGAACADTCPGAGEPSASCVPSPSSGALAVVTPPVAAVRMAPPVDAAAPVYSYIPSSPTPCDLSISRT
ncbi:hypothetical protein ACFWIX_02030 [Pseudarthrobacter sp. NPDC058362]|uniref:hypothetical protein n=1 Tax=Pseudarthrobacter sp. NPDC058362 TaxID=3346458 RepID=UPI00364FC434